MTIEKIPVLEVSELVVRYGKTQALHGVDLRVDEGEVVALIGANGAGKSTLLRAVSGLLKPASGRIALRGERIGGRPADQIVNKGVAHCPEERHVWPAMSVHENLLLGAYLNRSRTVLEQRLAEAYERFPRLKERQLQMAGTLSGGEQQMLAIARALMSAPSLLLLDEPSLGLSPRMADEVFDVVRRINAQGVTVLLVEQNVHNALGIASRAYVFETGRVSASRDAASLLGDPELLAAYLGGGAAPVSPVEAETRSMEI
jgi:branched-chain amino acid transport system ATP-binding protein